MAAISGASLGADNHCQTLAQAAGRRRKKTWHRLSLDAGRRRQAGGECAGSHRQGAVARMRRAWWLPRNVADLACPATKSQQADVGLTRRGAASKRRGDTPNRHDVLTGSLKRTAPHFCARDRPHLQELDELDARVAAMLGNSDRMGCATDDASKSWNSSHPSRGNDGGCSQADLKSTGGDGLL